MLGQALIAEATAKGIEFVAPRHETADIAEPSQVARVLRTYPPTVVINAAGIIPEKATDPTGAEMIRVNAIGPRVLAGECSRASVPLIHVSSDCVFDGRYRAQVPAMHRTMSDRSATDDYGLSKWLGETPGPGTSVVRTSFVGPGHGLWEWLAGLPPGATISGYDRAWWSGSTVWAVARALMEYALMPDGVVSGQLLAASGRVDHLATHLPITKALACGLILDHLGRSDVKMQAGGPAIDRSLRPTIEIESLSVSLKRARAEAAS